MKLSEFDFRVWSKAVCGDSSCKCAGFTYGKQALATLQTIDNDSARIELWAGWALLDINGAPIFEGDIVKAMLYDETLIIRVDFTRGAFFGVQIGGFFERNEAKVELLDTWHKLYNLEVIGNIHENPNLSELAESIKTAGGAK